MFSFYGCIYGLRSPSGKWYIGQTTDIDPIRYLRINYNYRDGGGRTKLRYALLRYGFDSFNTQILVYCFSKEELDKAEIGFIEIYNSVSNGYNIDPGGNGKKHSLCTKESMSRNRLLRKEELIEYGKLGTKARIELFEKDPSFKEDVYNRISESMKSFYKTHDNPFKNKKHSEEFKSKIGKITSVCQSGSGNSNYGNCWIYNNILKENKRVKKEELQNWIGLGWIKGRNLSGWEYV